MHYGAINIADCANGVGVRTALFVSGCTHRCKGCFQPETWDFAYGKPYTQETEAFILKSLEPGYVDGLTILGGEPMEPENQPDILSLLEKAKRMGKNTWVYSGYTWEQLHDANARCRTEMTGRILSIVDVLVDGEFHIDEKDVRLAFKGSRNQRIIDVQESLKTGMPVLAEEYR